MRALTFQQPYASAALGPKPIDNRKHRPPLDVIGKRIAIHAGLVDDVADHWDLHAQLVAAGMNIKALPLGCFLGTALVRGYVRCPREAPAVAQVIAFGSRQPVPEPEPKPVESAGLTAEQVAWALASFWRHPKAKVLVVLGEQRTLPQPIPWPGALGFWEVPEAHRATLEAL